MKLTPFPVTATVCFFGSFVASLNTVLGTDRLSAALWAFVALVYASAAHRREHGE